LLPAFDSGEDALWVGGPDEGFGIRVCLTSQVDGAQQRTINFANNNLLGSANFLPAYKTSKARLCYRRR
jgi:type I restriction enzyme R subunit